MTPKAVIAPVATALAALIAVEGSALAQYDRDGRYVPSPRGVPQDPYARPIPMYPGTPGSARKRSQAGATDAYFIGNAIGLVW